MNQRARRTNGLNWPKMSVLILDANQRPALAITRSLGKRGIPVIVAGETEKTLSGSSKYCLQSFVYPSPHTSPEQFLNVLINESIKRNVKIIFPVTEITTYLMLKNRGKFEGIIIPFAAFDAFEQLTNKWKLFELAQELDIPIPKTIFVNHSLSTLSSVSISNIPLTQIPLSHAHSPLPNANGSLLYTYGFLPHALSSMPFDLCSFKYPVVLKPYRSRILSNGNWISASVKYASSITELKEKVAKTQYLSQHPFLIQEYVEGEGRGIYALYNHGKPVTFFAHRRIREKPPSGGVSVLSESIEVNTKLKEYARRLLDYVGWHGVAMVEFKVSKDGKPYLMEVNARFWGSLQLAIDSGVDFPWLLYEMAIGNSPQEVRGYKVGVRSRWLLGDMDNLYLTIKNKSRIRLKILSLIKFLNFFERNTHYEINRWDDLSPFFTELKKYLKR